MNKSLSLYFYYLFSIWRRRFSRNRERWRNRRFPDNFFFPLPVSIFSPFFPFWKRRFRVIAFEEVVAKGLEINLANEGVIFFFSWKGVEGTRKVSCRTFSHVKDPGSENLRELLDWLVLNRGFYILLVEIVGWKKRVLTLWWFRR